MKTVAKKRWAIRGEQDDGSAFWLEHFSTRKAAETALARIEGDWRFPLWVEDTQKRFQVCIVEGFVGDHYVVETFDSPSQANRCAADHALDGCEVYVVDAKTNEKCGIAVLRVTPRAR